MQARAESGEELSGVRPYTLETEDGDEEYVYAAWGLTWTALVLYSLSLWLRRNAADTSKEPS